MKLEPIKPWIGAEVKDIDLKKPLKDSDISEIRNALHTRGVLVFRNQDMSEDDTVRFAHYFGRISKLGSVQKSLKNGVSYVSNTRPDGAFGKGELVFHNDMTFFDTPCKGIMLYGMEVPSSGSCTLFSNTAHSLRSMPTEVREKFEKINVLSSIDYDTIIYNPEKKKEIQKLVTSRVHPLVIKHPWSDEKIIFLSQLRGRVDGLDDDKSAEVMKLVDKYVRDEPSIYRHSWSVGDLVFWDNFLVQHARDNFDDKESRTLRRCVVAHEDEPIAA